MKEFRFPKSDMLMGLIRKFSPTEKALFSIFTLIFIFGSLSLFWKLNTYFMTEIPARGGTVQEGVIGIARFINPLLAQTDVDRDLTSLIYAGLMRNINGNLVPDIAESYTVSDDGLTYDFKIKENAYFHDGVRVTAEDIAFTIEKAQDSTIKSPRRALWNEISTEIVNSKEIKFILKHPFSPFIYNTTIGILPKHLWKDISAESFVFSEQNSNPVGAGPYSIDGIEHDSRGLPTKYILSSYKKYTLGRPYISTLEFSFFPNEAGLLEAYYEGLITSLHSVSATEAEKVDQTHSTIIHTFLPRTFAVFFNQNQSPVLANPEVRQALDAATDRNAIIKNVLKGYGVESDGPLPIHEESTSSVVDIEKAKTILTKAGWTTNSDGIFEKKTKSGTTPLAFSLTTTNASELKQAAELIKQQWEKIGASVTLKIYENGDLQQNIIRPRKYDALLFGEVVGHDLDLYAYWHSSQRNDPGLNIVLYANSKVDKLIEEMRSTEDTIDRLNTAKQAEQLITNDTPAVFLYSPDLIYITSKDTHIPPLSNITTPTDRFGDIMKWYINTDHVWNIFVKNNNK
jgi:peptide/nickel transport system substrate-binding protein